MQGPRFGMIRIIGNSSTDSVARVSCDVSHERTDGVHCFEAIARTCNALKVADRGGAHCQLGVVATVDSTRLEMAVLRKLCLWKINKWFWY